MKNLSLLIALLRRRNMLILLFFLLLPEAGYGQETDTVYYNWLMKEKPGAKRYSYYRILTKGDDSLYHGRLFTRKGKLQKIGSYRSKDGTGKTGKFSYFFNDRLFYSIFYEYDLYNDTIKRHLLNRHEDLQELDSLNITLEEYYRKKCHVKQFCVNDIVYCIARFYTPQGELMSKIEYLNRKSNGPAIYYFTSKDDVGQQDYGKIHIMGRYKNDKKDGEWMYYRPDGTPYFRYVYEEGKIMLREKL